VLVLAFAAELAAGDPVTPWHPVALFGRAVAKLVRVSPARAPHRELLYGFALVGASVGAVFVASASAIRFLWLINSILGLVGSAALLKISFSFRQLEGEAARVAELLEQGSLVAAEKPLAALVGRDLRGLSPTLAASAAVESLAENLSDSFVAPLFYYVVLGVPGALAYRAINTLDAMIGYHGRYEYLGRAAARLDDLVNMVPARMTAVLLVVAAWLAGANSPRALAIAIRDGARTESPNAGWPMAAMAGALELRLEKAGHYQLGAPAADPSPAGIRRAIAVARRGALIAAGCALVGSSLARPAR